uniref:Putative secreted protein n=1 Tax=Ixodes ricinus TaxID=34613 RepID=A0A6B0U7A4_IXORI
MPLAVLGTLSTGSIRVSHAQRVEFVGISRVRDIWLALHLRWRESVPHVNHRRVIANLDNAGWDCVNNVRHNKHGGDGGGRAVGVMRTFYLIRCRALIEYSPV